MTWRSDVGWALKALRYKRQELAPRYNTRRYDLVPHPQLAEEYEALERMIGVLERAKEDKEIEMVLSGQSALMAYTVSDRKG